MVTNETFFEIYFVPDFVPAVLCDFGRDESLGVDKRMKMMEVRSAQDVKRLLGWLPVEDKTCPGRTTAFTTIKEIRMMPMDSFDVGGMKQSIVTLMCCDMHEKIHPNQREPFSWLALKSEHHISVLRGLRDFVENPNNGEAHSREFEEYKTHMRPGHVTYMPSPQTFRSSEEVADLRAAQKNKLLLLLGAKKCIALPF